MDVLSDVLRVLELSGAICFRAELSAPWALAVPDSRVTTPRLLPSAARLVLFHVVVSGRCWIALESGSPLWLETGDAVVLPHGSAHQMGGGPDVAATPVMSLLPPSSEEGFPALVHGGGGPEVTLLCGFLGCDRPIFDPLLTGLPPLIVARRREPGGEWLDTTVRYMLREVGAQPRPGGRSMQMRLTEILFVEVLRRHLEELPEHESGWIAALRDPHIGRAVAELHADPSREWTVTDLARCAGVSRSGLADRFRRLVGQSPIEYLTRWRLQLAARLLRAEDVSIAEIADRVGYDSEAAFHRAFKRFAGVTPATWRRA
jgi:AraC-like DNA-binding protein